MRNAFNDVLIEAARKDEALVLLVGDIGFKVFDAFRDEFPDRFYNVGIAEANMIGVAAGLAMAGMRPVVYTIIPFLVMRAFEQIRVDLCMHNLPVRLVGVGGGLAYDILGPTHHSIEDLAIMRALPNMKILTPCDPEETKQCFLDSSNNKGPTYIRLGKGGENNLLSNEKMEDRIQDKAHVIRNGKDILFVVCGPILEEVLGAADDLAENFNCGIININTLKPFDHESIRHHIKNVKLTVTVEEHNVIGGLGSAVAETVSSLPSHPPLLMIGIQDIMTNIIGKRDYLLKYHQMDAKSIGKRVRNVLTQGLNS
jgi:transketolase